MRAFLLSAALLFPLAASAQSFTPTQRDEIVRIVREALKSDPAILRDALSSLQADWGHSAVRFLEVTHRAPRQIVNLLKTFSLLPLAILLEDRGDTLPQVGDLRTNVRRAVRPCSIHRECEAPRPMKDERKDDDASQPRH